MRLTTASTDLTVSHDLLQIPAGLHPAHLPLIQDSIELYALFQPRSFADLAIYHGSIHDALKAEQLMWAAVGDRLAAGFPGFNLVRDFSVRMLSGYSDLAALAARTHQEFRALHAADYARHESPRVNEHYADVTRWGGTVANIPDLSTGGKMHGAHVLWLETVRTNLGAFRPEDLIQDDRWNELRHWLFGLCPLFYCRAKHAVYWPTYRLTGRFPIEDGVADVVRTMGRGFADLADYAAQLALGFEDLNPHDRNRRDNPKPCEELRDVGNASNLSYGTV